MSKSRQQLADFAVPLCRDPFDDDTWRSALGLVADTMGALSATLGVWSATSAALADPIAYTWPPEVAAQFFDRYHEYEPLTCRWKRWLPALRTPGQCRVFTSEDILPDACRSDDDRLFYEEYADPNGIGHVGGILVGDGQDQITGLYLYRPDRFKADELDGLRACVEHLQSAVHARRCHRQRDALASALERADEANLFIDRELHVYMCSAGSEAVLERAGMAIDGSQRLTSKCAAHLKLLDRLLGRGGSRRGVLEGDGGPRFVVSATPSSTGSRIQAGESVTFHVCVVDLWQERRPTVDQVREVFPALTPTEARVASWAVTFLSRKEMAHKLGMSDRTVQVHMHRIYDKTGINWLERARDKNHRALLRRLLSALGTFQ